MAKRVSLGIMEQSVMRKESIGADEEQQIRDILDHVTHVEGKYLGTLKLLKDRVTQLGGPKPMILHAQYPTHGDVILNMVDPGFLDYLGEKFREIIETFDPEWFSFHLGFCCEKVSAGGQFDFCRAESEILPQQVIEQRIVDNMAFVKKNYLKRGEILLENLDYNPKEQSGAYEYVCDPDFISRILERTGCRMLLDVGHVNVSARNMGYQDVLGFAQKLPLEKVMEIHMSGAGRKAGLAHDTHIPIHKEGQPELGYLEELLKTGRMTSLAAVTLETFEEVIPQLDLLRKTLERCGFEVGPLAPTT